MKPEVFEGSIQKGTNQLYITTERQVIAKNVAFVKIEGNEIFYRVENIETINLKKKFDSRGKSLVVKGDFTYKIAPNDIINLSFQEYEAVSFSNLKTNESAYKVGEKIYAQGGSPSSNNTNLTGQYTEFTVQSIDDEGKILKLKMTRPGKYILPPSNPVSIMNQDGNVVYVDLQFEESPEQSILERQITYVENKEGSTSLGILYPIPQIVEEGELTLRKQILLLDKPYAGESIDGKICEMTFDFSPLNGIPLLPPASLDPHATFNEAIRVIEQKFLDLEKRISNLENRNS